jgi:hypothetical protein
MIRGLVPTRNPTEGARFVRTIVLAVIEPTGYRAREKILGSRCRFPPRPASLNCKVKEQGSDIDRRTKMKMNKVVALVSMLFAAAAVAAAGPAVAKPEGKVDAGAAFSRLKGLAGEWNVESARGKGRSQFELIAGGSVVLERFAEPGGGEMLTLYHLDGDNLVLTHYCMAGNVPHMVAEKFDAASGELNFAFAGGANIGANTGHMHDAAFRLISNDRFDAKWNFVEGGKLKFSEDVHYIRVK